jgi:hypothetical protein
MINDCPPFITGIFIPPIIVSTFVPLNASAEFGEPMHPVTAPVSSVNPFPVK